MKRSTRGFTLIELLLAFLMLSALLTVVAVALGGMARTEGRMREQIDRQRNMRRMVMQLRADLHGADTCSLSSMEPAAADDSPSSSAAGPSLELTQSDGRSIHFRATDAGMERTVTHDGRRQHREFFGWQTGVSATWSIDSSYALPTAVLTLTIPQSPQRAEEQYEVHATLLSRQPESTQLR